MATGEGMIGSRAGGEEAGARSGTGKGRQEGERGERGEEAETGSGTKKGRKEEERGEQRRKEAGPERDRGRCDDDFLLSGGTED